MILRKSDRPRRKLMRVTSLVVPVVGALLALGFMTAPAANAAIVDNSTGAMQAESEKLHQEQISLTRIISRLMILPPRICVMLRRRLKRRLKNETRQFRLLKMLIVTPPVSLNK